MKEIAEEFIQNYFKSLIEHHNTIFGIHSSANLTKINFITYHEDIFSFVNLVCQIDTDLEDEFLDVCLDDIINLMHFTTSLEKDTQRLEIIYSDFLKSYDQLHDKDEVFSIFKEEYTLHKQTFRALLNTKFFFLDKYLWDKIKKSKELRQLLKIKNLRDVDSTIDYLKHTIVRKSYMRLDYSSFHIDLHKKYKASDIEYVKSLAHESAEQEYNEPLEQLVRYKKHIPYFKDIEDQDIREIVKDVKFCHYNAHEILIKEFDDSKEIYFLVRGECRATFRRRPLGKIECKTIFGEFAFITKELRSATIKTNENSVIISFNFDLESFDKNPCLFSQLYKNISQQLVKKIYTINQKDISL